MNVSIFFFVVFKALHTSNQSNQFSIVAVQYSICCSFRRLTRCRQTKKRYTTSSIENFMIKKRSQIFFAFFLKTKQLTKFEQKIINRKRRRRRQQRRRKRRSEIKKKERERKKNWLQVSAKIQLHRVHCVNHQ